MDQIKNNPTIYPKNTIHVAYAHGYDDNMIVRTLPNTIKTKLWNNRNRERGVDVWINGRLFNLYYRQQKFMRIREFDPDRNKQFVKNEKTGQYTRKPLRTFTLWYVWPFFQSSFVKAIEDNLTFTDEERKEVDLIAENKEKRSEFKPGDLDDIAHYCGLELKYLVKLCEQLHHDLKDAGHALPTWNGAIARWDGPGAIAAALLHAQSIKDFKSPPADDRIMQAVQAFARCSYFGARIEQYFVGRTTQTCYHYDVNSAYPSGMPTLPCLAHGHWEYTTTYDPHSFGMWDVVWDYTQSWLRRPRGPFPFPLRLKDNTLCYPPAGGGTYHTVEVNATIKNKQPDDHLTVVGGWIYRQHCDHTPFAFVQTLYDLRAQWKKEGRGGQRILKLGLNSIYGKLAQQLGAWKDDDADVWERIPPYHELLWAGAITANTRAKLYDAAMIAPDDVVMIQTDGLTTRVDISDHIPTSKKLGEWEPKANWLETYTIQPGIYFCWTYDEEKGKHDWTIHYRGFDPPKRDKDSGRLTGPLTPQSVLQAWRDKVVDLPVTAKRFIGFGSCVVRQKRNRWVWRQHCQWVTMQRNCTIFPTKYVQQGDG